MRGCNIVSSFLIFLFTSILLCGCGSNNQSMGTTAENAMVEEAISMDATSAAGGAFSVPEETNGTKFVYTANLDMETTTFEESTEALITLVAQMDGYLENSSTQNQGSYRYGNYVVRLPQENLESFTKEAETICLVVYSSSSAEDISFQYYDTQGRLETQEIKQERLQTLLEKAETMEDIITIETAISETEQYIDELSGTMKQYDSMVDYATINVYIQEVTKLSNVVETPIGFGGRIVNAFNGGITNFVSFCENLVIFFVYNWLWLLILAGIVTIAIKITGKRRKKQVIKDKE